MTGCSLFLQYTHHRTMSKFSPAPLVFSRMTPSERKASRVLRGLPESTPIEIAVKRIVDEVLPKIISKLAISLARDKIEQIVQERILCALGSTFDEFLQRYRATGAEADVEDYDENSPKLSRQIDEDVDYVIDCGSDKVDFVGLFAGEVVGEDFEGCWLGANNVMTEYVLNMFKERNITDL